MSAVPFFTGVRLQGAIDGPARIELRGDMLEWVLARGGGHTEIMPLQSRAHAGCLRAFRRLRTAGRSPLAVLNFAERWGVLAILPSVREKAEPTQKWWEDQRADEPTYYSEPTSLYVHLAQVLDFLVKSNNALRTGTVPPTWKTASSAYLVSEINYSEIDYLEIELREWNKLRKQGTAEELYRHLTLLVSYLIPTGISLGLSSRSVSEPSCLGVNFGFWDDGCKWDRSRVGFCRLQENHLSLLRQFAVGVGISDTSYARPSGLYNALIFELMREIMPAEGAYYCSVCGTEYFTGGDTGRRGPRSDKNGNTCGEQKCRKALKRKSDAVLRPKKQSG